MLEVLGTGGLDWERVGGLRRGGLDWERGGALRRREARAEEGLDWEGCSSAMGSFALVFLVAAFFGGILAYTLICMQEEEEKQEIIRSYHAFQCANL